MNTIGSFRPIEINGRNSFRSLAEASQAAAEHQGVEAIRQRDDGEFEVLGLESSGVPNAQALQSSAEFRQIVSFDGTPGPAATPTGPQLSVQLADGTSLLIPVASLGRDQLLAALKRAPDSLTPTQKAEFVQAAAPIIASLTSSPTAEIPVVRPMEDKRMDTVANTFATVSREAMEKEFRFAPEGSDKWKLYKAMELLGKLNSDAGAIKDPEAQEVLTMRRGQLEDLIQTLNAKPEIQEAYTRIRTQALTASGLRPEELREQVNYVLSDGFLAQLKGQSAEAQQALIHKEIGKIQFFDPELAQVTAAELGARTLVVSGLEQYRGLSPEKQAKARQVVEYLIDDAIKGANTTQDKGLKPLRELQKLASSLPPAQWEAFRKLLVNEVFLEEGLEKALEKANALDGKKILKAVEAAQKSGQLKLSDSQLAQIEKIKWHGDLTKALSTLAAVGTGISLGRSIEELQNKGLNLKSTMDLVSKTISLIGASKDIAATGSLLLKQAGGLQAAQRVPGLSAGLKAGSESAKELATFFEGFKLVKWAGPITSAISAVSDGIEWYDRAKNEDQAGKWLKGIGTTAGVVAAGAGGAALWWSSSATVASVAGPVGLAAVAVVGAAAITYNCVKESEETGEFRQALRQLGLSSQAEQLEAGFQKAAEVRTVTSRGQSVVTHDAAKGFAWAKDKPVAERATLIGALMDQATDPYEEEVISRLFKDAVGKNHDATGVDDFDRLVARTDLRRVGRELQPAQLESLIAELEKRGEGSKKSLERLAAGIAADHEYGLLTQADGQLRPWVEAMPPAARKELAAGIMTGYTSGKGEQLLSKLVLKLPPQELAELLVQGGPELVQHLVEELPQGQSEELLKAFIGLERALGEAKQPQQAEVLKKALGAPLNACVLALAGEANRTFYSYEDVLARVLTPEITQHLDTETLGQVCRKLMDTTVWTPDQSSAALVKLLRQTTPAQFDGLMKQSTDTFLRRVIAGSTTYAQSKELLGIFLAKGGGQPNRHFQTVALGMMHQPTAIGMDWSYENAVRDFLAEQKPPLKLDGAPALKVVAAGRDVGALSKQRGDIAKMSLGDKAAIVKYLMDAYTSDASETLIHDILVDTHHQSPAAFRELVSQLDCYQLAKELGDPVLAGQGDDESLEVMELIARDGDPRDFTAYANGVALDRNQTVLCNFTSKAANQPYLKNLPPPVVKEMCEALIKGWTTGRGEIAITMLLKHASDEAFLGAVKDKTFASWLTSELQTNDANWFKTATGDDDQIKTLMQRLGRLAQQVQAPGADKALLAQKADIAAALESFTLACAQADYPEVIHTLATHAETTASVQLLSPAALKAAADSLISGWASGKDQEAVSALLEKTTPKQLRELLGGPGGQAMADKLARRLSYDQLWGLTSNQLNGLMRKMLSDGSVNAGMGFSYLASAMAKQHHGDALRDLIVKQPDVVRAIHPTVLQNIVLGLSEGWTSSASRETIAGILSQATPEQLELILQSNTADARQVSNWVVYTLKDAELGQVLENLSHGKHGRGMDAFLGSLAHDKPAVIGAASTELLRRFGAESLAIAAGDSCQGYAASTLGGDYKPALDKLLAVAESQGDASLKIVFAGMNLAIAGPMLTQSQNRFDQLLKQVTRLGDDRQFTAFISKVPTAHLMASWPELRDSRHTLSPGEREAFFKKCVDATDFPKAMEVLKGVPGTAAAGSLLGQAAGREMVGYLAEHLGDFGKAEAIEAGKLILGYGSPEQIDASFKQINTRFYAGRGADVVREILGSVTSEAEKKAIFGKLPLSTLEHLVGTMDSSWYKTIGQISGSYSDNLEFLHDIARLVEPAGKRTMIVALANSWWTPPKAEQLMFDILKETSFAQFGQVIDGLGEKNLKLVLDNLENDQQAGTVAGWIGETEIRQTGSTGNLFNVAAGHLAYGHRSEAVNTLRQTLKDYKHYGQVRPEHVVMLADKLMAGATHSAAENAIYQLLKDCDWPQFAQVMNSERFRKDLQSELSSEQWAAVQQWLNEIPQHVP